VLNALTGWRRRIAAKRGSRTSRDPHWDNVRYFSGTLVVFVHMTNVIQGYEGLRWLYIATWAMRVPVFVLVAGYFSRADALTPREARRLIESIVVPYLAIGLLHTLQMGPGPDGEWTFHTIDPAWGMWFLLSLLCWRAALPYLAQLRYPLGASVVMALVAGYVAEFGYTGSLSRTFGFLPFFLLGWKIREGLFAEALRARWSRDAALGVLAAAFVGAWFLRDTLRINWLRMRGPYDTDAMFGAPWAWTVRGMILLAGMVIALSFIRLIPRRRLPVITYLGAGGLYIYLLHPLVLRPLHHRDAFGWADSWPGLLGALGLAGLLAAALASPPLRWLTRPLVQPCLPWLFRAAPAPPVPSPQRLPVPPPPTAGDETGDQPGVLTIEAAAYTR
jgi:fucose 4-O-acetylase-like acetyltransferase